MIQFGNGRARTESTSMPRPQQSTPEWRSEKAEWPRTLEKWIGGHPLASIAFAVCLGAALGWIIKRR